MNLLGGLRRIDRAGRNKDIPKQGAGPFVLLLALTGHESDTLGEMRERREALVGDRPRRLAAALHENPGQLRRRLDESHGIEAVRSKYRLSHLRHDESSEAVRHGLGVESDHAVGPMARSGGSGTTARPGTSAKTLAAPLQ